MARKQIEETGKNGKTGKLTVEGTPLLEFMQIPTEFILTLFDKGVFKEENAVSIRKFPKSWIEHTLPLLKKLKLVSVVKDKVYLLSTCQGIPEKGIDGLDLAVELASARAETESAWIKIFRANGMLYFNTADGHSLKIDEPTYLKKK